MPNALKSSCKEKEEEGGKRKEKEARKRAETHAECLVASRVDVEGNESCSESSC